MYIIILFVGSITFFSAPVYLIDLAKDQQCDAYTELTGVKTVSTWRGCYAIDPKTNKVINVEELLKS